MVAVASALLLSTIVTMFVATPIAEACGCGGHASSPVSVRAAAAVFVGTAETVTGGMPQPRIATFTVTRMYRGTVHDRIIVAGNGTTCDVDFQAGIAYVVYAERTNGGYTTHKCTRTRPLAAGAEDVRYLDMLAAGEPRAVIHGEVLRRTTDREGKPALQALFETVEVVAQRAGHRRSVRTDQWGPFQLVLTPGEYNVWAERKGRRVSAILRVVLGPDEDRTLSIPANFPCRPCDSVFARKLTP
jgi:hypothetical protein